MRFVGVVFRRGADGISVSGSISGSVKAKGGAIGGSAGFVFDTYTNTFRVSAGIKFTTSNLVIELEASAGNECDLELGDTLTGSAELTVVDFKVGATIAGKKHCGGHVAHMRELGAAPVPTARRYNMLAREVLNPAAGAPPFPFCADQGTCAGDKICPAVRRRRLTSG